MSMVQGVLQCAHAAAYEDCVPAGATDNDWIPVDKTTVSCLSAETW